MSDSIYMKGIFKTELKNRFLCLVEVNGTDTLCYIPSSCRLSNFLDLTGKTVLLKPISSAKSRTKYSVYALYAGRHFVLLNMALANSIIADALHGKRFAFLGKRTKIKRECVVEGYKCDIFIEDTKTILEIKSILAFNAEARFPSVYSQRAIDQLRSIERLLRKGYRVVYIFVSVNQGVKRVDINENIKEYYSLFTTCFKNGMLIKGYKVTMKNGSPIINGRIDVFV